jgi:hypothetical protein
LLQLWLSYYYFFFLPSSTISLNTGSMIYLH